MNNKNFTTSSLLRQGEPHPQLFTQQRLFGSGFLARPFGAILFGRIGDLIGRKSAFVWSIVMLTLPTFMMGCLPTYAQIGIYAPLLLASLRFLQSIPAAGETPGTICYLYENADPTNRKFMTSWTQVGNQIGAIIGLVETFLMDHFMSDEFQMSWGWRISFWVGGLFGLFGIYLRRKLDETPVYKSLKEHCRIDKESVIAVLKNHKKTIAIGTAFGVINASTFYLLATYIPTYLDKALGLSPVQNAIASLSFLILTTILLPFFGILGEKINIKSLLVYSSVLIIALLYPLYLAINNNNLIWIAIIGTIYVIPITLITAYMGFILAHLFPAPIRFTAVGVSFNLADGIVGGFSPAIALFLPTLSSSKNQFLDLCFDFVPPRVSMNGEKALLLNCSQKLSDWGVKNIEFFNIFSLQNCFQFPSGCHSGIKRNFQITPRERWRRIFDTPLSDRLLPHC